MKVRWEEEIKGYAAKARTIPNEYSKIDSLEREGKELYYDKISALKYSIISLGHGIRYLNLPNTHLKNIGTPLLHFLVLFKKTQVPFRAFRLILT